VWRNGVCGGHMEAFHGLGVQEVTEFISDWCSVSCLLGGKNRKRKRKNQGAFFFQGRTCLAVCVVCCYVQLKADLRVNPSGVMEFGISDSLP
jgi:hypothetical protein